MKTQSGHLTAANKKAIKAILNAGLTSGNVGGINYYLSNDNGLYTVVIAKMDRGLVPCVGSELRISKYKSTFTI